MAGSGTREDPWELTTANGGSAYQMWRDEAADPPVLVCQVGSTKLTYHLQAIDDLHAWLKAQGDWVAARRGRRAEGGARGHGRGVGPRRGQPGGRLVRHAQGLSRPVRRLPAAAPRGARPGRSWSTTRRTTGSARSDAPAITAVDGRRRALRQLPAVQGILCGDDQQPTPPRARSRRAPSPTVRGARQARRGRPHHAPDRDRRDRRRAARRRPRGPSSVLPAGSSCQEASWDVRPAASDLPVGYTLSASQYDINRQQVTFLGPLPADETSDPGRRLRRR